MNSKLITERDCFVNKFWIFKNTLIGEFILLGLCIIFGYAATVIEHDIWGIIVELTGVFIFISFLFFVPDILIRKLVLKNFHYSFEDNFIKIKQGFWNKNEGVLNYRVIKQVSVSQGLLEKFLNLATLKVEVLFRDYSVGSIYGEDSNLLQMIFVVFGPKIGLNLDTFRLPYLKKKDAEILKKFILDNMKKNSINNVYNL
jgi:membrane protein YdbS with pleckstrin-like domain